jgi:ComEC/Rec2-related protein
MRSDRVSKIVFCIVILLLLLQLIKKHQASSRDSLSEEVRILHIQTERHGNCWFSTLLYSYQVPNCSELPVGFAGYVIGRVTSATDNSASSKKRLIFESLETINQKPSSVKDWGVQVVIMTTRLRSVSVDTLDRHLESPQAEIFTALLFGGAWRLDQKTQSTFETIGIVHIIAASGMHLSIIVSFLSIFQERLSRRVLAVCSILLGGGYVLFALYTPSLLRAFAMLLVGLVTRQLWWRPTSTLRVCLCGAGILLWIVPDLLTSIGFQLSFAATLGILLFSVPYLKNASSESFFTSSGGSFVLSSSQESQLFRKYFWDTIVVSLGAQLAVAPLLLFHFGSLSLFGVFATSTVAWIIPLIFSIGLCTMLALFVFPSWVVVFPVWLLLSVFVSIARTGLVVAQLFTFSSQFTLTHVLISYVLLGFFWCILQEKTKVLRYVSLVV